MSEKRFVFKEVGDEYKVFDLSYNNEVAIANVRCHFDSVDVLVGVLNEQQATIQQLQAKLREKEEDEQLYANEIVKLNKEAKEVLDFKSLGGDY